jgi:hypothetical protein
VSQVDQVLHGYREGHRLLAASRELSAADRQRIAVQTDNSDAARGGEWAELLAGYPLPSGLYAWSMTWPAPEMPRPGCVWAHTLLFEAGELGALSPGQILACFRRPKEDGSSDAYGRPLALGSGTGAAGAPSNERALLSALIWSFYEAPLRPVRVTGVPWSDSERHAIMLGLWLQQWPSLRELCSFTDAPSTPRRIDERRKYDLQLHRGARAQAREEDERILSGLPKKEPPRWASDAAGDLVDSKGLGKFLHAYGSEAGGDRSAFSVLCEIWGAAGEEGVDAAAKMLGRVCELFGSADLGQGLKGDLLDPGVRLEGGKREPSDRDLLLGLLNLKEVSALPIRRLDLRRRLGRIVKEQPTAVGEILSAIGKDPNALGVEVLDLVATGDSRQLRRWLSASPDALRNLISMRPQLAGSPALWREIDAESLWSAISSLRGKKKREEAVAAMVDCEVDLDPSAVLEAWPESGGTVLEMVVAAPKRRSSSRWLGALPGQLIVEEVNANHAEMDRPALRALLSALEPEALGSVKVDVIKEELEETKAIDFTAKVFVAAALNASKQGWEGPALGSFERLGGKGRSTPRSLGQYLEKLSAQKLDPRGWEDRTARVLNLAFQEDSWDPLEALSLTQAPFKRLIEADKKAGLARRMLDAGSSNPDRFKKWQKEALIANVEERADRASLIGLLKRLLSWSLGG